MQCDWNMIRWLLKEAQACPAGCPLILANGHSYGGKHQTLDIGERSFEEVYEHILLLGDSGLAKVRVIGNSQAGPTGIAIERLTMTGHEFIKAAQNETIWNQGLKMVNEKGGAVTVGIFIQILSSLVKKQFGLE